MASTDISLEDRQYHDMYRGLVLHEGAWGEHPESLALVGDDVDKVFAFRGPKDMDKCVLRMIHLFGGLVKYLCGDELKGVSIGLDARQSSADLYSLRICLSLAELKTKLPVPERFKSFFGHFIHEVGHLLYTRSGMIEKFGGVSGDMNSIRSVVDATGYSHLVWDLCTTMEDRRVETLMLRRYPGYKSYLEAARKFNVLHAWCFGKDKMDSCKGDFDASSELPETLFHAYALHRVMLRSSLDDYEFMARIREALASQLRGYSIDDVDLVLDEHYETYGDCLDAALLLEEMLRGKPEEGIDDGGKDEEDSDGSMEGDTEGGGDTGDKEGNASTSHEGSSSSSGSGGSGSRKDNYRDLLKGIMEATEKEDFSKVTFMGDNGNKSYSLRESGNDLERLIKEGIREYFGADGDSDEITSEEIGLSRERDLMSSGGILEGDGVKGLDEAEVLDWRHNLRACDLAYSVPVIRKLSTRSGVILSNESRIIADVLRRRYRAFSTVVTSTREFYELDEGDLDDDEVHLSRYSQDVFCDTQEVSGGCLLEIIALLDLSGSMGGSSIRFLRMLAAGVSVAFSDNVGVLYSAYGHTTTDSKASPTGESLLICPVCEKGRRVDLGKLSFLNAEADNVDGYAIRYVAGKFEKTSRHRLLLVLSDGAPCGSCYDGEMAILHTRSVVEQVRSEGVSVLSVSLNSIFAESQATIYGDTDIIPWEGPKKTSEALVRWISKRFERGVLEYQEESRV